MRERSGIASEVSVIRFGEEFQAIGGESGAATQARPRRRDRRCVHHLHLRHHLGAKGFPGAVVAGVITLIGSPFAGKLADRVGATTVMIPTTIVGIIAAWPMFILLTSHPSIAILTVCEAIVGLFMVFYFGPMPALLS